MAKYFAAQIVATLAYLRQQNVVHRDLKPANIVLNEKMQVRLTDFGTAKVVHTSQRSHSSNSGMSDNLSCISGMSNISAISGISANNVSCPSQHSNERVIPLNQADDEKDELVGSEHFISPEMLEFRQTSYASDIWALGVILFQMLTSKLPFKGRDQDHTFELIKKCQYEVPKDVPAEAKDLIEKILVKNPLGRIGSANINDLMAHPFF